MIAALNRPMLSVNDLHIGVQRVSGTTPQTAHRLRDALQNAVRELFMEHTDKHLYVNGDALDAYNIEMSELLRFYRTCCEYLDNSYATCRLILGRGNHDIAKDSTRMSAFDFLCAILTARYGKSDYGPRVVAVTEPQFIFQNHYVIPHLANQELFNLAIEQALARKGDSSPCYLHLHANYDNDFAVEADHSLNVSREQAKRLFEAGYHLVFGHEHQQRDFPGVTIVGNQFPTSIADCLDNDQKRALIFHPDGAMEEITTWEAEGSFLEVPWNELNDYPELGIADFLRVTGTASPEEAAKVMQTISKFRQQTDAYVVAPAVKFTGQDEEMAELDVAASEMKALDVLEYLFEQLEPEQAAVVKRLLAGREGSNVAA